MLQGYVFLEQLKDFLKKLVRAYTLVLFNKYMYIFPFLWFLTLKYTQYMFM